MLVNDHDEAYQGTAEDAGQEGEGPDEQEGSVVLGGQRDLLTLLEGIVPKGRDRVCVQRLWEDALERTPLWHFLPVVSQPVPEGQDAAGAHPGIPIQEDRLELGQGMQHPRLQLLQPVVA